MRFFGPTTIVVRPRGAQNTISNGVFEPSAKSAFSPVFYRVKQALPRFVGEKTHSEWAKPGIGSPGTLANHNSEKHRILCVF